MESQAVDLLQDVTFEGPVVETIRQLGETWDGGGPLGLKGEEILVTARVLAVANAFVGMVSPRAYRGGSWWYLSSVKFRAADRYGYPPGYRGYYLGLRLARNASSDTCIDGVST